MSLFEMAFVYGPLVLGALASGVLALALRPRAAAVGAMALLACLSKFLVFHALGGDTFVPDLPAAAIVVCDWAYSGAFLFSVFLLVCAPFLPFASLRPRMAGLAVLAAFSWCVSARGVWNGLAVPAVRTREIVCPGLPAALDGYRILQLSDLHVSSVARRARTERVVAAANAAGARVIVMTGDIVDGTVAARGDDVAPLARLSAPDGVFFITGNHEYYRDLDAWYRFFKEKGFRFLHNACVVPVEGLAIGGVPDQPDPDVARAFSGAPEGAFRVLLQHRPGFARENAAHGVGLQLSGHTHGGVLPGLSWLVKRYNGGFARGLYAIGDMRLFVSPGVCQWAGFPIRLFNESEMTLFVLRRPRE
jgi:predicted MPP superfamily phosphohydrolase